MNKKNKSFGLIALPLVCFCTGQATAAEQSLRGQGVLERSRVEYAPVGMKLGGFTVLPALVSENEWKDNIYSTQTSQRDDFIFHVKPSLAVRSNWSRHALLFNIDTDIQNYATHDREDKDNYALSLGGRFDVMRDSFAHAKFTYANQYENRGMPDSMFVNGTNFTNVFNGLKPTNYQTYGGLIGYEHKLNRIRINVDNETTKLEYENGMYNVLGGGTGVISNDKNRSRLKNESSIRLGYEINPNYEAFVKGSYNFIDYDARSNCDSSNTFCANRSSDGFGIVTGIALDFTGKLTGDAYIGYQEQDYDAPQQIGDVQLRTISGVAGGLGLKWLPTSLTTVKTNIDRTINETTQGYSSGYFSTSFLGSVDHELLRNLILSVNGGYILNEYEGSYDGVLPQRTEDVYTAGVSARYLINRNFYLKGGYNYNSRETNIFNTNYDINSVYLTIGSQL